MLLAQVEVPAQLIEDLIEAKLLSGEDAADKAAISQALVKFVTQNHAGRA